MNGDIIETKAELPSLFPDFKKMCLRVGVMMIVVFAVRCISTVALSLAYPLYRGWGEVEKTLLQSLVSVIFLNVIPITAGLFILKFPVKSGVREMYVKPRYFGRALGMFPAGYGLAIVVSALTRLVGGLFEGTAIGDSFNATQDLFASTNMTSAVILFVHSVVLAPLFEEFWFRGVVLKSLRPYGNGFAIFVSALLFGLTHANLAQFFYATVIGVILGYIAVQTGSIVTTTVTHAMFNGIGGITSLFLANKDVQRYLVSLETGIEVEKTPAVIMFTVWSVLVLALIVVGFVMAIIKFVHIKRYHVPKVQTELSAKRRWGIFMSRPTVIIMLLMALDTMTWAFLTQRLIELFSRLI